MISFNESLKNWLLGKSEIDFGCSAVPPVAKEETAQELLDKFKSAKNDNEIAKISTKLGKMGYEVKAVFILSKKQ